MIKNMNLKWIGLVVVVTVIFGTMYATGQQVLRQGANDPQVQIAEDMTVALAQGQKPEDLFPPGTDNPGVTLSPYVAIYDDAHKPVISTMQIDGTTPVPPAGVFDYAKAHVENRVTWQLKAGVRSAIVVRHYDGPTPGFVVVGRSLREVENRSNDLLKLVGVGWAVSLLVIAGLNMYMPGKETPKV